MWRRLDAVETALAGADRPRTLWLNMAARPGSQNDDTMVRGGAHNLGRGLRTMKDAQSKEVQISLMPEVIIYTESAALKAKALHKDPDWQDVPAVRNGRLHPISIAWTTTGSPYASEASNRSRAPFTPRGFPHDRRCAAAHQSVLRLGRTPGPMRLRGRDRPRRHLGPAGGAGHRGPLLPEMAGGQEHLMHWQQTVVWQVRMPRTLTAAMVGATLAICGAVLQGLFRNPLASSDILGVTSGARSAPP